MFNKMQKISDENLNKIVNFIYTNTKTDVGYPLMEMIRTSFSKCECEEKIREIPTVPSKDREKVNLGVDKPKK